MLSTIILTECLCEYVPISVQLKGVAFPQHMLWRQIWSCKKTVTAHRSLSRHHRLALLLWRWEQWGNIWIMFLGSALHWKWKRPRGLVYLCCRWSIEHRIMTFDGETIHLMDMNILPEVNIMSLPKLSVASTNDCVVWQLLKEELSAKVHEFRFPYSGSV